MQQINIKEILKIVKTDRTTIAQCLFPYNTYPEKALQRQIREDIPLDSSQMFRLAILLGCEVSDLYTDTWKAVYSRDRRHVFENGDWKAFLDTSTWVVSVYCKNTLQAEKVITSPSVSLSDFIEALNKVVTKTKTEI
jgi:hypothetical protein